jgi:hypothetical protein
MRPFASTTAALSKDTVIWSFNGQNCSLSKLNWINARRSQKNGPMLFFIQNVFFAWKYDRLFPSVKSILNKEDILCQVCQTCGPHVVCGPHDNTNGPIWPSVDPRFDIPGILNNRTIFDQVCRQFESYVAMIAKGSLSYVW